MAENEHTGSGDKRAGRAHSEEDAIEHDLAALAGDAVEVDEHGLKLNLGLPDEERNAPAPLQATPEELAAVRAEYGFDQPVIVQYLNALAGVLRGDLGFD